MTLAYRQERRSGDRPVPPKPVLRIFLLLQMNKLAKRLFSSRLSMAILLIVFIASLSLIGWSLFIRLPEVKQSVLLLNEGMLLQNQLNKLNRKLSKNELPLLEKKITREKSRIFSNFPDFANWLNQKAIYARQAGLDMHYLLTRKQATSLQGIYTVSVEMTLKTRQKKISDDNYPTLLKFMRSLIDENWHLEIAGNKLKGNNKGINVISIELIVWVKDPDNMIILTDKISGSSAEGDPNAAFIQ